MLGFYPLGGDALGGDGGGASTFAVTADCSGLPEALISAASAAAFAAATTSQFESDGLVPSEMTVSTLLHGTLPAEILLSSKSEQRVVTELSLGVCNDVPAAVAEWLGGMLFNGEGPVTMEFTS